MYDTAAVLRFGAENRYRCGQVESAGARHRVRERTHWRPPIAAIHADAESTAATDWQQIAAIYERLFALHPTPIVALNHAVAVSMADGPAAALPLVDALSELLDDYHLWHATRADLLRRLDRHDEAVASYRRALPLAGNEPERRFLARRISELTGVS